MGDQNDRLALGLEFANGLHQGLLASVVQVRIGFVQNNQARLAVDRARQRNPLPLAARQQLAGFADGGVITLGKSKNHLVQAGALGGRNHAFGVNIAKPGDVLGQRTVEQFDVLWKVPQVRAEFGSVPTVHRQGVKQDFALNGRPDADQHTGQRGFSGPRWTENRCDGARFEAGADAFEDRRDATLRRCDHLAEGDAAGWRDAAQRRVALGVLLDQPFQPQESRLDAGNGAPGGDDLVNRAQRASHQHVAGNHGADGHLAVDDQQRAGAQHQRLLAVPDELAPSGDPVTQGLRVVILFQVCRVLFLPLPAQVVGHAHGLHDFHVLELALKIGLRIAVCFARGFRGFQGVPVAKPPDEPLDQREQDGKSAKPGTQEKQHADIDGGPWRIKEREDTLPGQELPNLNQVGERAGWMGAGLVQVSLEAGVENTCAERLVDGDADADQQSGPEPFGRSHDAKQEQADQGNGEQGEVASTEHDPVINL